MIAGIDFSTKAVDVVLLDDDTNAATWHRFELTGQDAFDRARAVRAAMPPSSLWDDVLAVGIEQPRGNHGVVHLARIQGAVLACLPRSVLVQPWNPSGWRKAVGLPGNASKGHIAMFANGRRLEDAAYVNGGRRMYPREFADWPQDACDAYCIALATRRRLEISELA